MPEIENWSEMVDFTGSLANVAAACTTSYFRHPIDIMTKQDKSPVTIADQETERLLREMILKNYPSHGILGEEHGSEGLDRDDLWVIDPIDGTKSFIAGLPVYGTLIAYMHLQRVRIGAISMPAMHEFWIGVQGQGCFYNGEKCNVSACTKLSDAILMTTSPDYFTGTDKGRFSEVSEKTRLQRYGGDCYIYGMLASGWTDIVIEQGLQSYDYMALVPVIQEAGGIITDWSGDCLNLHSDGNVLAAATPELHQQALDILRR
ncbi:histidinol-phosphatase [Sneathiella sp.]|uniref:histidinol-phosphatase n=1 Tax=Sneathiella sp. TaxID=1964365 RepID=UPI003FA71897